MEGRKEREARLCPPAITNLFPWLVLSQGMRGTVVSGSEVVLST